MGDPLGGHALTAEVHEYQHRAEGQGHDDHQGGHLGGAANIASYPPGETRDRTADPSHDASGSSDGVTDRADTVTDVPDSRPGAFPDTSTTVRSVPREMLTETSRSPADCSWPIAAD